MISSKARKNKVSYSGRGITCRQDIEVEVELQQPGHGLVFEVFQNGESQLIPAHANSVVHTLRNVVLGVNGTRLCIVEHFLAAATLWGLEDLLIKVHGPEMPLGDGSAKFWLELFASAGWSAKLPEATLELKEPIICRKADKYLLAIPADRFSMSYHMDWNHPAIGKRWQHWDTSMSPHEIADARTFGALKEHQLLGIENEVVSLTPEGFSMPLRFEDEPVRHKLLDLLGDLALSGVNPMSFKARFVSMKAGHELDVEMARSLAEIIAGR
jgi:UDP-3-O-[3-hydroxymyristoyl] N-acetylglucosamine deacetylase